MSFEVITTSVNFQNMEDSDDFFHLTTKSFSNKWLKWNYSGIIFTMKKKIT